MNYQNIFLCVPSLYVRVYRRAVSPLLNNEGSLTVCEGVSKEAASLPPLERVVPSLYVRVYHQFWESRRAAVGSLTVCEGVSAVMKTKTKHRLFPHCM